MHKMEIGPDYCIDPLKMMLNKLTLYFYEFNSIFYEF
jgi:hypothetical protein